MMNFSTVAILVFIVLVVIVGFRLRKRERLSRSQCAFLRKRWARVLNEYDKDPSKAIMEADKLLDWALSHLGYRGSMGEKLKKTRAFFPNIEDVWFAHKLRNKAAHDVTFELSNKDAMRAMTIYKKAINLFL